ncbi:MAG: hypothetical protein DI590_26295 [Methylorubrum populi]|nr:MAG: hypothetical protein DI590_26295 [Methylorubrum populi]
MALYRPCVQTYDQDPDRPALDLKCATSVPTMAPTHRRLYSSPRPTRGERPLAHLAGFSGVLVADGYAGFNELYKTAQPSGALTEAAQFRSASERDPPAAHERQSRGRCRTASRVSGAAPASSSA